MKTSTLTENSYLIVDQKSSGLRRLLSAVLIVLGAALLGWNVAHERWLLLVAVAAAPLLALWPVPIVVGAFAFLVPFDAVAVIGGQGGITLTFISGVLAALVLLITGYLRKRLERPTVTAVCWVFFIAWGALSVLWAINQDMAINALPTCVGMVFLYLAGSSVRINREELNWIVLATIMGGCAAAVYSSSEYYSGVYFGNISGRSSLMMGENATDPNVFAASLFLPLSLAVGRFFDARGWHRTLYLAMAAVIAVAAVLTMSRGAMLGLAVMVVVYFRRLGLDRRVLIPVAIVALGMLFLPSDFIGRVENAGSSGGAGRLYIWESGLAALKHYGLIGAGLHNFGQAYTQYLGEGSQVHGYGDTDAHNDYLLIAVELGPLGIALMGMALYTAIKAGRKIGNRFNQGLALSMISYEAAAWAMLTSSFFVGMLWRKAYWLVWIMYALALRVATHQATLAAADARKQKETHAPMLARIR